MILIEGGRTNYADNSQVFAVSATVDYSISADSVGDPTGTTLADRVSVAAGGLGEASRQLTNVLSGSQELTISFFGKSQGGAADIVAEFSSTDGTPYGDQFSLPKTWDRFDFAANEDGGISTPDIEYTLQSNAPDDFDGWGLQVERNSFPTSPIISAASILARSNEIFDLETVEALSGSDFRIRVIPEFSSTEVRLTDSMYWFFRINSSFPLSVGITPVSDGVARIDLDYDGDVISSANCTFNAGDELTITVHVDPATLELSGFGVGDGTYRDLSVPEIQDLDVGSDIFIGKSLTPVEFFYGLISSFEALTNFIDFVSGEQTSLNTVDVVFDLEPKHIDPTDPKDATNEDNWTITVSGAPSGSPVRLVQSIIYVGENTVRINFDGPLVPTATYTFEGTSIESVDDESLLTDPFSFSFVAYDKERGATEPLLSNAQSYDLANPQTPTTAGSDQSLGTLQVTDEGDLENDTGRAALKKRILRRVSTVPGGFAHLPTYGVDLQEGKLIRSTDLRRIQINVEKQVREEPGVVSVRVAIAQPSPGIIRLRIRVRDSEGLFAMTEAVDTTEAP
jgi:hypothetical protein